MTTTLFNLYIQARCAGRRFRKSMTNAHTVRRLRNQNNALQGMVHRLDGHVMEFQRMIEDLTNDLDITKAEVKHMEEDWDIEEITTNLGRQIDDMNTKIEELENDARNGSYVEEEDVAKIVEEAIEDEMDRLVIDGTPLVVYTEDMNGRLDDAEETLKTLEKIDLDEIVETGDALKRFLHTLKNALSTVDV